MSHRHFGHSARVVGLPAAPNPTFDPLAPLAESSPTGTARPFRRRIPAPGRTAAACPLSGLEPPGRAREPVQSLVAPLVQQSPPPPAACQMPDQLPVAWIAPPPERVAGRSPARTPLPGGSRTLGTSGDNAVNAPPECRRRASYVARSTSTHASSGPRSTTCFRTLGSEASSMEEYRRSRAANAILASITASGAPRQ